MNPAPPQDGPARVAYLEQLGAIIAADAKARVTVAVSQGWPAHLAGQVVRDWLVGFVHTTAIVDLLREQP